MREIIFQPLPGNKMREIIFQPLPSKKLFFNRCLVKIIFQPLPSNKIIFQPLPSNEIIFQPRCLVVTMKYYGTDLLALTTMLLCRVWNAMSMCRFGSATPLRSKRVTVAATVDKRCGTNVQKNSVYVKRDSSFIMRGEGADGDDAAAAAGRRCWRLGDDADPPAVDLLLIDLTV
jgi:hypothetical protein